MTFLFLFSNFQWREVINALHQTCPSPFSPAPPLPPLGPECVMALISAQRKIHCFHAFVIWSPVISLGTPGRAFCPEKSRVCVGGTQRPPSPSYILRSWVKSLASVRKEDQTLRTGDTEPHECRKHRWNTSRLSYLLHEPYGDHDWKCLPHGHTPPYVEDPNFSLLSASLDVDRTVSLSPWTVVFDLRLKDAYGWVEVIQPLF